MIDKRIISNTPKSIKFFNIIKRIFSATLSIIFILIILVNLMMIISVARNPDELPSLLVYKVFVITSGSMEPTINVGDFIIIKNVEMDLLEEQDIITFVKSQNIITHRIVDITEENKEKLYTTKGDNNNVEDLGYVKKTDIQGKYILKVPFIGKIILFAQSTSGRTALLLIPAIIIFFVFWRRQERENKKLERDAKRQEWINKHK